MTLHSALAFSTVGNKSSCNLGCPFKYLLFVRALQKNHPHHTVSLLYYIIWAHTLADSDATTNRVRSLYLRYLPCVLTQSFLCVYLPLIFHSVTHSACLTKPRCESPIKARLFSAQKKTQGHLFAKPLAVASGVWQFRGGVRQQDLLLYEQRGWTDRVATCLGHGSFPPDTRLSLREEHLGVPSSESVQLAVNIDRARFCKPICYQGS